jgi:glycosyltransferase involved in cell wall biosynthesis
MERQSHALITHLSSDVAFTVLASEGLEELPNTVAKVHLSLPRRPAFARIVIFYFRSTLIARRLRRNADVVHGCGALSGTQMDLATVHLCHAAVARGSRGALRGWRSWNAALARQCGLWIERRQYRRTKVRKLVAVSNAVEMQLEHFYPTLDRVVIANGVDVEHFRDVQRVARQDGDPLRVVMVTGDFALKGVDVAMQALRDVPSATLCVVGRGALGQYREKAGQWGIGDRVEFVGQIDDVRSIYARSDVVLCMSNYEAFGLFLVEAALAGCAVVSTRVGVAPELVDLHCSDALIENNVRALVERLERLTNSPDELRENAAFALAASMKFSTSSMAQSYLEQYRTVAHA